MAESVRVKFDLSEEDRAWIKSMAALAQCTMSEYLHRMIVAERATPAGQALESLRREREDA